MNVHLSILTDVRFNVRARVCACVGLFAGVRRVRVCEVLGIAQQYSHDALRACIVAGYIVKEQSGRQVLYRLTDSGRKYVERERLGIAADQLAMLGRAKVDRWARLDLISRLEAELGVNPGIDRK